MQYFFIFIFLFPFVSQASLCFLSLSRLIHSPDFKMLYNSGKSLNDLGFYEDCNKDARSKYVLITGNLKEMSGFKIKLGFCGPVECTIADYNNFCSHLEPFIKLGLNMTENTQITFSFYFPSELNSDQFTAGGYIMISIMSIIVLLCIIGTLVDINENYYPFIKKPINRKAEANENEGMEELLEKPPKKTNLVVFFCCFSYYSNFNKLVMSLSGGSSSSRLEILNGIRVISILWVIYGHSYYYYLLVPVMNPMKILEFVDNFWYQILFQAPLAVDTFFFLAGFLSSYLMMSEIKKKNGKINFFMLIFHRFYRIMPLYVFLIFMAWKFQPYINEGPVWPEFKMNMDNGCYNYWWTNIIFLNNFISWENPCSCFGWGWYLANDFQFFLITPLLLLLSYRYKKFGWLAIVFVILSSYIVTLTLAIHYDYAVDMVTLAPNYLDFWNNIYCKPYCRVAVYLIGVLLGNLYLQQNEKTAKDSDFAIKLRNSVNNKKWLRYLLYFLAFWFIALPIFLPYHANHNPGQWSTAGNALYITFSRSVFILGVCFFVYPCLLGHATPIYKFLSGNFWTPLARLTFATYLVHPLVIQMGYFGTKQGLYLESWRVFYIYCGHVVISFLLALVISISIESPLLNIEKNFIFKRDSLKKNIEEPKENIAKRTAIENNEK